MSAVDRDRHGEQLGYAWTATAIAEGRYDRFLDEAARIACERAYGGTGHENVKIPHPAPCPYHRGQARRWAETFLEVAASGHLTS